MGSGKTSLSSEIRGKEDVVIDLTPSVSISRILVIQVLSGGCHFSSSEGNEYDSFEASPTKTELGCLITRQSVWKTWGSESFLDISF